MCICGIQESSEGKSGEADGKKTKVTLQCDKN